VPCKQKPDRVDATGRARAGSQRQLQTYVNYRRDEFSQKVLASLASSLGPGAELNWVSPLEEDHFNEYRDGEFLEKLGLGSHEARLKQFWPLRGPCWDALAIVEGIDPHGVVLVEAKSHASEMDSACRAGAESRQKIEKALAVTAEESFGTESNSCWTGHYYQTANRYAHLHFLRKIAGVPSWLVNVYFVEDKRFPTTEAEWHAALEQARERMGLSGKSLPLVSDLFVKAPNI